MKYFFWLPRNTTPPPLPYLLLLYIISKTRTRHLSNYWRTKDTVYPSNIMLPNYFDDCFRRSFHFFVTFIFICCIENENHVPCLVLLTAKESRSFSLFVCLSFNRSFIWRFCYTSVVTFSFSHFKLCKFHSLFINCFYFVDINTFDSFDTQFIYVLLGKWKRDVFHIHANFEHVHRSDGNLETMIVNIKLFITFLNTFVVYMHF